MVAQLVERATPPRLFHRGTFFFSSLSSLLDHRHGCLPHGARGDILPLSGDNRWCRGQTGPNERGVCIHERNSAVAAGRGS